MTYIKVRHINFHYELLGEPSNNPPIVLVAGYTCDINFWRPVAEHFSHNTQVLIFDNQGIGKTVDNGEILTVESMAVNIVELTQALGFKKQFILMGFALGGIIAQKVAADYPDKVNKLVLLNSVCQFNQMAKAMCKQLSLLRAVRKFNDYAELIYNNAFGSEFKNSFPKEKFTPDFIKIIKNTQTAKDQQRQVEALIQADASSWIKKLHRQL